MFTEVPYFTETAARETLEQVMANALSKSGSNRSAVRAVCLAVSGVNHPTDQQRLLNWLRFVLRKHLSFFLCLICFLFVVFPFTKYILYSPKGHSFFCLLSWSLLTEAHHSRARKNS